MFLQVKSCKHKTQTIWLHQKLREPLSILIKYKTKDAPKIDNEHRFSICYRSLEYLLLWLHQVYQLTVMAKGDAREVGFQDGGCFSRFLKRERINNQTFIAFLKPTLTLTLNLTTI